MRGGRSCHLPCTQCEPAKTGARVELGSGWPVDVSSRTSASAASRALAASSAHKRLDRRGQERRYARVVGAHVVLRGVHFLAVGPAMAAVVLCTGSQPRRRLTTTWRRSSAHGVTECRGRL